jgi:hypothetical protein
MTSRKHNSLKLLRSPPTPSQLFEVRFAVPTLIDDNLVRLFLLHNDQDLTEELLLHSIMGLKLVKCEACAMLNIIAVTID